ncbi:MAG: hypothetical protein WCX61_01135 [Candidatus Peribacteraceae bacterium]
MPLPFLHSKSFWISFWSTTLVLGIFFTWELGYCAAWIWSPPRPLPTQGEMLFTALLILLFALNMGLFAWRRKQGTCPVGTRRASAIAGALGAVTLLCPACLLLPFTIFGTSLSLLTLAPHIPLLRIISFVLLIASTLMLWPKRRMT